MHIRNPKIMVCYRLLQYFLSDKRFRLVTESESNHKPSLSFVVPIHNQQNIIYNNLISIVENSTEPFELILINDASNDNSHSEIMRFLYFFNSTSKYKDNSFRYFRTRIPIYETRCDDFGIRESQGEFVVEVQADMKILARGFDSYLIAQLRNDPRIGVISCRGLHNFSFLNQTSISVGAETSISIYNYFKTQLRLIRAKVGFLAKKLIQRTVIRSGANQSEAGNKRSALEILSVELQERVFPSIRTYPKVAGWLGHLIDLLPEEKDHAIERLFESFRNVVWIGETCMRGPLVFRKETYLEVGGFECQAFYQGLDDHDFCAKLQSKGYLIAFIPILFSSPLRDGLGRRNPKLASIIFANLHWRLRRHNRNSSNIFGQLTNS